MTPPGGADGTGGEGQMISSLHLDSYQGEKTVAGGGRSGSWPSSKAHLLCGNLSLAGPQAPISLMRGLDQMCPSVLLSTSHYLAA